jgi:sigma-B regulation protein RsbU (phosphoserine phosphatase)
MATSIDKATILAVDDTPENLDVVKGILDNEYIVKAATSGPMALKIVEKQPPDLVLLDIMMPEMDGYEVCERLKANPTTASIPVIFLTAKDQDEDEAKGFELGAADYIQKPVNALILKSRTKTHVQLKRNLDALREAYELIDAQRQRMQDELDVGRDIQMSMLPTAKPDVPHFSVEAMMRPAREVGGDFYDFFPVGPQEYAFCVADVSDKGVASALFMSVTKALINARCREDRSTASAVTWVNDVIAVGNENCMFITLFIAVLDTVTGKVRYTNAGHNPPYLRRAEGGLECISERHGPMVGVMGGIAYGEGVLQMSQGDTMVLFTDGVTEAMNHSGDLYGESRLEDVIANTADTEVQKIVDNVLVSVREYVAGAHQSDDITLLAFSYDTKPSVSRSQLLEVCITNKLSAIREVTEKFECFCEEHAVPPNDIMKVNLVFDEILSNIISYGYTDEAEHEIKIVVELTGQRLVITIQDDGFPFNPFAREAPGTVGRSIEEREIGGLGIHLVQQFMDDATYKRQRHANVVTFCKYLTEGAD